MSELDSLARLAWNERLAWTILHSLWQIAAITAVFVGASFWLRRSSARARYALGCLSLLAMIGLPLATFVLLGDSRSQKTAAATAPDPFDSSPAQRTVEALAHNSGLAAGNSSDFPVATPAIDDSAMPVSTVPRLTPPAWTVPAWTVPIERLLPWISSGWLLGVVLFSLRPLLGLWTVRRLRSRGLSPPPAELARLAENLVARFHIRRPIRFAQSALVQVPTVLGYLWPVVLLPASALTGLTTEQLEMILAHELAHIRRNDYLVNVLQTMIETLLFYHPGAWWVSARVRAERENCCDDVAVELCGNRNAYVGALLALEQQRAPSPLALAATGGSLVQRARRLLAPTSSATGVQRASAWLAGMLPMGAVALLLLLGSSFAAKSGGADAAPAKPEPAKADVVGQANPAAAESKAKTDEPKATGGDAAPAAKTDSIEVAIEVTLEDDAKTPLKIALFGSYKDPLKTWNNVTPGDVRLELPKVENDRYRLDISADGYSPRDVQLNISRKGIGVNPDQLELYRRRYAVLRYAVNLRGERDLVGPNVKEGRVAISFASVPDLHGDWRIAQDGEVPTFRRSTIGPIGCENGFALPPADSPFEEIKLAPPRDQYEGMPEVAAEKGMILLNRIKGNDPDSRRYAKILVEDVTETPPAGIQVIDSFLPATRSTIKLAEEPDDSADDRSSGEVTVTISLEDNAQAPVKLQLNTRVGKPPIVWNSEQPGAILARLPKLKPSFYYALVASAEGYCPADLRFKVPDNGAEVDVAEASVTLRRVRYAVLRYAINTKGERQLTGENVKQGRVGILSGQVPQLTDWHVNQSDGQVLVQANRVGPDVGFVLLRQGAKFDELDMAPSNEEYKNPRSEDGFRTEFPLEKGLIFFNRVKGGRPTDARYAKIEVEEITETPPADIQLIGALRPATGSANQGVKATDQPPGNVTGGEVSVMVGLEDKVLAPVKLELRDSSRKLFKAWDSEKPGVIRAEFPELKQGLYDITASAEGYSPVRTLLKVSDAGVQPGDVNVDLYRVRYLVLRYAINTKGEPNLTGENVIEGRVAVLFGSVPQLGDWRVDQSEGRVRASVVRPAKTVGFVLAREGTKFDELVQAPSNEEYKAPRNKKQGGFGIPLEQGLVFFNRVVGYRPEDERYAKLMVEEITDTRPENIELINSPR